MVIRELGLRTRNGRTTRGKYTSWERVIHSTEGVISVS